MRENQTSFKRSTNQSANTWTIKIVIGADYRGQLPPTTLMVQALDFLNLD